MTDPHGHFSQLKNVSLGVDAVEELHNGVVDIYAQLASTQKSEHHELHAQISMMHEQLKTLRKEIAVRMGRARNATLLLSLLAQQEDLRSTENRLDKQPYERYVDKEWFLARLQDATGRGDRDT